MKTLVRIYQFVFALISKLLIIPKPVLYDGEKSVSEFTGTLRREVNYLLVCDPYLYSSGKAGGVTGRLDNSGINYFVFTDFSSNPSVEEVEAGITEFTHHNCKGIIALGGGSAIDCAKGIAARSACRRKSIIKMKGLFKVCGKTPYLAAIPTTSGTGSEATVAAVISDREKHLKFAVNSFKLVPDAAVLDYSLTLSLPPDITASTGMDALTHALEAFTNLYHTKETRALALDAAKLIFENIYKAYKNGSDTEARRNMALAAFYAGRAFTHDYVGYIHAVAHSLGGLYGVPHGLANAVVLPVVMEAYGNKIHKKLAQVYDYCNFESSGNAADTDNAYKAVSVIDRIRELNMKMGIPDSIKEIRKQDIPEIVSMILKESLPEYPVPVLFNRKELSGIINKIMPEEIQ